MTLNNVKADASLLYAIQRTTNASSADILSYFYKIITEMQNSCMRSNARFPSRKIKSMYPGTGIPYQLEVQMNNNKTSMSAWINFPRNQMYIDNLETLMRDVAEMALLGGEVPKVEAFEPPALVAPRGKKHLINE